MNTILQKRIEKAAMRYAESEVAKMDNSSYSMHERKRLKMFDGYDIEEDLTTFAEKVLQNQWISVEEALPEDKTKVFVIVKTPVGIVHRADYHINDYWYMSRYSPEEIVTHWMMIPTINKEEK